MRRALRIKPVSVVLLAVLIASIAGCDGCEDGEAGVPTQRSAPAREPAPPPEGLLWEISIGGGAEAMRAWNEALPPGRARLLVPETPGELVDRMVGGLDLGARVADDATFHALSVQVDGARNVSAVRITVDPGPSPLGAGVALHPGAPFDGRFVGSVPGDEDETAVLVDDVLVFGERRDAVERALSYLAFTRVPTEVPNGIVLRVEPGVAADVRPILDQLVRRSAGEARAAVAEERSAHQTPPDFGDPETLIDLIETWSAGWIALLPDLAEIRATLTPAPGTGASGVLLDADIDVVEGSPLAALLAQTDVGDAAPLASLPVGTSLAWLVRSAHHDAETSFVADLARIGGDRVDASEHAALDALARSLSALGDGARFTAFGGAGDGAFALHGVEAPATPVDRVALSSAARGPFVRALFGRAFGCTAPRSNAWTGEGGGREGSPASPFALSSFAVCGERSVFVRSMTDHVAMGVSRGLPASAPSASRPDVDRALASLGDQLSFAAVLVPSRVVAAAPLVEIPPLAAMATRLEAVERDAPIVLGLSKRPGGVRLRILATTNAIEDTLTLLGAFE